MKLLYRSIPDHIKQEVWNRFKKRTSKEIIKSQKTIDITGLNHNEIINLILSKEDYENKVLKIIHIITKNGIYYLYLREFYGLIIDNLDCYLSIQFYYKN